MTSKRLVLLVASLTVVAFLLGGGLALRVGAAENSYQQAVLFAEILELVMDNYVDPVAADKLLAGAYEGMLGSLDANGAFLTPAEVTEWKAYKDEGFVDAGMVVLTAGRTLQVVEVLPDSPAGDAGLEVGDQIRSVDGRNVRDLSLEQARRLLRGKAGTRFHITVLRTDDGLKRERFELVRKQHSGRPYRLEVREGVAVLRVIDARRVDPDSLATELDQVASRVSSLLLDLRNSADFGPREVRIFAGLVGAEGTLLQLRDPSGRLLDSVEGDSPFERWTKPVFVLVNGATAGGAEALALLARSASAAPIFGEETYGLGAEARLYELEDGSGLLVSSSRWETQAGDRWNGDGIDPDEVVNGEGQDFDEAAADQLQRTLGLIESRLAEQPREAAPAAA